MIHHHDCGTALYDRGGTCACPGCQPYAPCPGPVCARDDGIICADGECDRELGIWPSDVQGGADGSGRP